MNADSTLVKVYFPRLKNGWKLHPYFPLMRPNWNTHNITWTNSELKKIFTPKIWVFKEMFDKIKDKLWREKIGKNLFSSKIYHFKIRYLLFFPISGQSSETQEKISCAPVSKIWQFTKLYHTSTIKNTIILDKFEI